MVRSLIIRSPKKIGARGTVHRLAVHARTEERPGGTIRRAVNTSISTRARRMAAIQIGGMSRNPIESNGQLTPRVGTVINSRG